MDFSWTSDLQPFPFPATRPLSGGDVAGRQPCGCSDAEAAPSWPRLPHQGQLREGLQGSGKHADEWSPELYHLKPLTGKGKQNRR